MDGVKEFGAEVGHVVLELRGRYLHAVDAVICRTQAALQVIDRRRLLLVLIPQP